MSLTLNAMDESGVRDYIKNYIEQKTKSTVKSIDIVSNYPIEEAPGWEVYFLLLKLDTTLAGKSQEIMVPKRVFTNGKRITLKLIKKGKYGKRDQDYNKLLKPKVPLDAYDEEHFLIGSQTAPHKIVLFSDPFCPYCQEKFPEIVNVVKKNPDIYALYYYHYPLIKIHPASDLTTKAIHIFHKRGELDKMMALYDLEVSPTEHNPKKIIDAIRKKTGVNFTLKELESEEVKEAIRTDLAMKRRLWITGTPTIFIDGKWDKMRKAYKQYAR
jgi:protein-disulfide isomerase